MGYPIDVMIGVQTGSVFAYGSLDMEDFKTRLRKVIAESDELNGASDISKDLACLSEELIAHKGSYVVIAGVFNYWGFSQIEPFTKRLSVEFGCAMCLVWEKNIGSVQHSAFTDGMAVEEYEQSLWKK